MKRRGNRKYYDFVAQSLLRALMRGERMTSPQICERYGVTKLRTLTDRLRLMGHKVSTTRQGGTTFYYLRGAKI